MCGFCGCNNTDNHVLHTHHHHDTHTEDSQLIALEQDILGENNRYAAMNRQYLVEQNIFSLNLVSSPGSGKTTLLEKTIAHLKNQISITVIEGDQQTDLDALRIAKTGVPVLQVNTGKACHLDAHAVGHALTTLSPQKKSLLFIENVGNLICPALFDLGEQRRVVILSVTEGSDKPLKYPHIFKSAALMLINKMDLSPHVDFDVKRCIHYAQQINPQIETLEVSAKTGMGFELWLQWLTQQSVLHFNR